MAATEVRRGLIDTILVFPGEWRGELRVSRRGDLVALLRAAGEPEAGEVPNGKKAVALVGNGRSGRGLGMLDAGTGFEPVTFRL